MIEIAVILSGVSSTGWISYHPPFTCSNAVVGFWEEHQAGNAIAALESPFGDLWRKSSEMASG